MIKVKTFTTGIKIFETARELADLDEQVTKFMAECGGKLISVSDTTTTDDTGATMGIIRVVACELPD